MPRCRARLGGRACAGALLALSVVTARDAVAQPSDGAYGRLDGDLLLSAGAGVAVQQGAPALAAQASALYLATAGLTLRYGDSLGADGAPYARSFAPSLELRPLFLGRFALDLERGPPHLDLLLDSLALSLGPFWFEGPSGVVATPGLELGAGVSVPLLPRIDGPVLGVTGLLRLRDDEHRSGRRSTLGDPGGVLLLTLSWQAMIDAGLVDLRRSPRER